MRGELGGTWGNGVIAHVFTFDRCAGHQSRLIVVLVNLWGY
jgi:hypothetical protein